MRLLTLDPEGIQAEIARMDQESKSLRRSVHDLVFVAEGRYSMSDVWTMSANTRRMVIEMFNEHAERQRRRRR